LGRTLTNNRCNPEETGTGIYRFLKGEVKTFVGAELPAA
jgi:hypothetical protein